MSNRVLLRLSASLVVTLLAGSANAIVSSNTGSSAFNGLDVGAYLGVGAFYSNGYTGTRAVVANIEAGHVWSGHSTLGHATTQIDARAIGAAGGQLGEFDSHATNCGAAIAGRGPNAYQRGIAYGADLWSAAIGTDWVNPPNSGSFEVSEESFTYAYETALLNGVNGRTADVFNSSWGGSGAPDGYEYFTVGIDAMLRQSGKIGVIAAGNEGPDANTVSSPANGYNTIAVAALGRDTDPVPYNTAAGFSSRGPQDFYNPETGQTIKGVRATVDIAAPGRNLTLATYLGDTGGNKGGTANFADNYYTVNGAGTSYAAPIVAGGASLIVDVGYDRFNGGKSIDGRVVRAVLMSGADKTSGWSNGQTQVSGVLTTTQAVDYVVGAGRMNLTNSFDIYTQGTTDVDGLGGGDVASRGWDYGSVAENAPNTYSFSQALLGGSTFTATLSWFANSRYPDALSQTGDLDSLHNLDLQLWEIGATNDVLIAQSISMYDVNEHLSFVLDHDGLYAMKVVWAGEIYDLIGDDNVTEFGLAWSATYVPAPGTLALVAFLGLGAARRRRG